MRLAFGAFVVLVLCAPALSAQAALDLSLGLGRGFGAAGVQDRGLLAVDATLSMNARRLQNGVIPVALLAHAAPTLANGDCVALPGAVCRAHFPSLGAIAVLSGWSRHADFSRGPRVLAGPAVVWNDDINTKGVGMMLRADYAESLGRHAAFVFGAQSVIAPRTAGARMATGSVTVGLRLR